MSHACEMNSMFIKKQTNQTPIKPRDWLNCPSNKMQDKEQELVGETPNLFNLIDTGCRTW